MSQPQPPAPSPSVAAGSATAAAAAAAGTATGGDRGATQEGHGAANVAVRRALHGSERAQLQQVLLSALLHADCAGEDVSDLLEYVVAMVSHGKTVGDIVSELAEMPKDVCDTRAGSIIAYKIAPFICRINVSGAPSSVDQSAPHTERETQDIITTAEKTDAVSGSAPSTGTNGRGNKSQENVTKTAEAAPLDKESEVVASSSSSSDDEVLSNLRTKKGGAAAKVKAKRTLSEAELADPPSSDEEVLATYRSKKKKKKKGADLSSSDEEVLAKRKTKKKQKSKDQMPMQTSIVESQEQSSTKLSMLHLGKGTAKFDPYSARMSSGYSPYYTDAPQALDGNGRAQARSLMACFIQSRSSPRAVSDTGKMAEISKWKIKAAAPKGMRELELRKDVRPRNLKGYHSHLKKADLVNSVLHYTFDDEMLRSDNFFATAVALDCAKRKEKKAKKNKKSKPARKKSKAGTGDSIEALNVQALLRQRERPVESLQYKCEICQDAVFESFAECLSHESQCRDGKENPPSATAAFAEATSSVEFVHLDKNAEHETFNTGYGDSFDISAGPSEGESQDIAQVESTNKDEDRIGNAAGESQNHTQSEASDGIEHASPFDTSQGPSDVAGEVTVQSEVAGEEEAFTGHAAGVQKQNDLTTSKGILNESMKTAVKPVSGAETSLEQVEVTGEEEGRVTHVEGLQKQSEDTASDEMQDESMKTAVQPLSGAGKSLEAVEVADEEEARVSLVAVAQEQSESLASDGIQDESMDTSPIQSGADKCSNELEVKLPTEEARASHAAASQEQSDSSGVQDESTKTAVQPVSHPEKSLEAVEVADEEEARVSLVAVSQEQREGAASDDIHDESMNTAVQPVSCAEKSLEEVKVAGEVENPAPSHVAGLQKQTEGATSDEMQDESMKTAVKPVVRADTSVVQVEVVAKEARVSCAAGLQKQREGAASDEIHDESMNTAAEKSSEEVEVAGAEETRASSAAVPQEENKNLASDGIQDESIDTSPEPSGADKHANEMEVKLPTKEARASHAAASQEQSESMVSVGIQDEAFNAAESSEKKFGQVEVAGKERAGMIHAPIMLQGKEVQTEQASPWAKFKGSQVIDLHISDGSTVHAVTTIHAATNCSTSEERAVSLLFRQLKPSSKGKAMLCLHCKKHRWSDAATLATLSKKKTSVSAHMQKCKKCPGEIRAELRAAFEGPSMTTESGAAEKKSKSNASKRRGQTRGPMTKEVTGPFMKLASSRRGKWCCKKCHFIPENLRFEGSMSRRKPSDAFMLQHIQVCKGLKPDLTPVVQSIVELSASITAFNFDTLCEDNFKAIVRQLVEGHDELVTMFTDDVRNLWFGSSVASTAEVRLDLWQQFPFTEVDTEGLVSAMANFAKSLGVGFDLVTNASFVRYVALIAPGYELPSARDLIECW